MGRTRWDLAAALRPLRIVLLSGLILLYAYILETSYRDLIAPVFSYLGQTFRDPTLTGTMLSIFLVWALALIMPTRCIHPSDFVLWVLFLIAIAPSILIAQYADVLDVNRSLWLALLLAGVFALIVLATRYALP